MISGIAYAGHPLVSSRAPEFFLRDQYDHSFTLHHFAGKPLILLACDKTGSRQKSAWVTAILDRYAQRVQLVGVADVRTAPFFIKGKIKRDFQKEAGSILMDWDGVIFRTYALAEKVANIVLIDRQGVVRYVYSGAANPVTIEALLREIDRLN